MGDLWGKSRYHREQCKENHRGQAVLVGQDCHPPGTLGFLVTFAKGITLVGILPAVPYQASFPPGPQGEQKEKNKNKKRGDQETLTWLCPEQFPRCE